MNPTYIETSKHSGRQFLYCDLWLIEQNIAGNYSRVGYSLKIGSGNPRYSTSRIDCSLNGSVYSNSGTPVFGWEASTNGKVIKSGEITVYHESDGNKSFYWGMSAGMEAYAKNVWGEGYITLNQIPRQANITGANDFNDEQNGYMTYNNAAGNAVDQLVGALYWNGSEALSGYRDVGKTNNNYTFNLSESERNAIRSRMANTNGPMNITYYLRTLIGGNYYYSSITKNIYITNANPTMGDFKFQDVNSVTKALTGNDSIIVKGKSNVRIYEITANAFKYATKKNVIVDGVSATWSDTYEKTINGYDKNNIGVAMSDSRGNTTSIMTKTIEAAKFKEYFNITKTEQSATRGNNGVGEATTFVCKGTWFNASFGAQVNTLAATYRYRKSGTSSWTTGTTAITVSKTGNNFTINQILKGDTAGGFNIENVYEVEIILTDKLSSATFALMLIAGSPAIAILGNQVCLGGKLNESSSAKVQVKGQPILEYTITKTW